MPEKRSLPPWGDRDAAAPNAKAATRHSNDTAPAASASIQFQVGENTIELVSALGNQAMRDAVRRGEECEALDELLQRLSQLVRSTWTCIIRSRSSLTPAASPAVAASSGLPQTPVRLGSRGRHLSASAVAAYSGSTGLPPGFFSAVAPPSGPVHVPQEFTGELAGRQFTHVEDPHTGMLGLNSAWMQNERWMQLMVTEQDIPSAVAAFSDSAREARAAQ